MPTLLYGGSFDPPHTGHLLALTYALACSDADRAIVFPSAQHPFAKAPSASFAHRLEMCRRAFATLKGVEVSDIEDQLVRQRLPARAPSKAPTSEAPRPVFTIEVVRALSERRSADSFRLVVGSDAVSSFDKWKDASKLAELAPLLPVWRGNAPEHEIAIPDIQSRQVRECLTRGTLPQSWLPKEVATYIHTQKLYQRSTA